MYVVAGCLCGLCQLPYELDNLMILRGTVFSKILEMETGISILVPNSALGAPLCKVVYLLHGVCGRSGDWLDYTMLPVYAEKYSLAFVMPEVARSFYSDMAFGQKFYSYIVDELPGLVANVFKVSARREDTAVIGASMGGYGALKCALSRPEQYGYCAAFSSACLFLREGLDHQRRNGASEEFRTMYGERLINDFVSIFGVDLAWREDFEISALARRVEQQQSRPELFMACGADDFFAADNRRFAQTMENSSFAFTYREWPGGHDWAFFNQALERSLEHFFAPEPRAAR